MPGKECRWKTWFLQPMDKIAGLLDNSALIMPVTSECLSHEVRTVLYRTHARDMSASSERIALSMLNFIASSEIVMSTEHM